MIDRDPDGTMRLTGIIQILDALYDDVDGPSTLPFKVVTGPMASGSAVMDDGLIWRRLIDMGVRKIVAVDIEAATIASVARDRGVPYWLVAEGVTGHADASMNDRFGAFAARASLRSCSPCFDACFQAPLGSGVVDTVLVKDRKNSACRNRRDRVTAGSAHVAVGGGCGRIPVPALSGGSGERCGM